MCKNSPKVSVGMPVLNGEKHLEEAIQCVLNQTISDIELIISDNASTDGTEQICRAYSEKDSRVRYYRNKKNIGVSENYNAVFYRARGEYFKWASANDIIDEQFLAKCVDVLVRKPDAVLTYPKTRLFTGSIETSEAYDDNLNLQDESAYVRFKGLQDRLRLNNAMNGVIRTAVLHNTPLHKEFVSSDVCLMGVLVLYGKFVELPEYLFYRRMDRDSCTKYKSDAEVLDYFAPSQKSRFVLPQWSYTFEYWSGIRRVQLPASEKAHLYLNVLMRMMWSRNVLMKEINLALRTLYRSCVARLLKNRGD